jgi:hypothetical protein
MFENSPAGLRMMAAEVSVTVTREEQHQGVLALYPVRPGEQRTVAVELAWCRITSGKYRGQQAIEVRLDGNRVGELTYLMSQRYGPLVTQALAHGARPGCEAHLERDARGLQLTLRLPSETQATVVLPAARPAQTAANPAPVAKKAAFTTSEKRGAWIVAGAVVFVLILFAGIIGGGDEDDPSTTPLADQPTTTTTVEPPPTTTTTTTPPPTTTTTTTVPAPPPEPVEVAPPPPPPQTQEPEPEPAGCDPNYSGCVPIASDVDCAGGSGNGPAYATGPVDVIGSDIYDLDRDSDGVACE